MDTKLPFELRSPKVIIKREAEEAKIGVKPEDRTTARLLDYGVINLNKPKGPTSHMTSDYVQKVLGIDKAGHGGTLDPGVTGVLPIAIGQSTRIVQTLLLAGKEYVCLMHMHTAIDKKEVQKAFKKFTGKIMQMPPVKSAVKRELREREVYYIQLLEIDGQDVLFKVGCQAGTYIRKLVHDIGKFLKTGAHMSQLVRTKAGPFKYENMITLQDLEDAMAFYKEGNDKFLRHCILPVEFAASHLPKIWIDDSAIDSITHGAPLYIPGIIKLEDDIEAEQLIGIYTVKDELIALAKAKMTSREMELGSRGCVAQPYKVFMERGVYGKN